jgi:anti-sigma B factor antagonist
MPEVNEFRIEEERAEGDAVLLTVHGEADLHVAPEFRDRLTMAIDQGTSFLVLDFSDVTFVDSMTLGVVLGGMKRLRARGGHLRLVVPQGDMRRMFEITLLDRVLTIDSTREAALEAVAAPAAKTEA